VLGGVPPAKFRAFDHQSSILLALRDWRISQRQRRDSAKAQGIAVSYLGPYAKYIFV
jgi:hypothetical protein